MAMDLGLINLVKPSGISSRQAIDPIERQLRPTKVGHAGTLDPLATGVLVVMVGQATRLTSHVQAWPKTYRGTFLLGRSSDTEDIEGQIVEESDPVVPSRAALEEAARSLTGDILQQPPAYSALKVQGRRAYELARAGKEVDLAARPIHIRVLNIETYDYPRLQLYIECSSGTYVRSLGRDLAKAVGTNAIMSSLVRLAIGHLRVEDGVTWEAIRNQDPRPFLLPAREALRDLPSVTLTADECRRIAHGLLIERQDESELHLAALTPSGDLAALLLRRGPGVYGPQRNFLPASGFVSPA